MSCAKTAEPIEMQFGMSSRVGPGNMCYMGCRCPIHREEHFLGVWPKSIANHRILGVW